MRPGNSEFTLNIRRTPDGGSTVETEYAHRPQDDTNYDYDPAPVEVRMDTNTPMVIAKEAITKLLARVPGSAVIQRIYLSIEYRDPAGD